MAEKLQLELELELDLQSLENEAEGLRASLKKIQAELDRIDTTTDGGKIAAEGLTREYQKQLVLLRANEKAQKDVADQIKRQGELAENARVRGRFDEVSERVSLAGDVQSNLGAIRGLSQTAGLTGVASGLDVGGEMVALIEELPRLGTALAGLPSTIAESAKAMTALTKDFVLGTAAFVKSAAAKAAELAATTAATFATGGFTGVMSAAATAVTGFLVSLGPFGIALGVAAAAIAAATSALLFWRRKEKEEAEKLNEAAKVQIELEKTRTEAISLSNAEIEESIAANEVRLDQLQAEKSRLEELNDGSKAYEERLKEINDEMLRASGENEIYRETLQEGSNKVAESAAQEEILAEEREEARLEAEKLAAEEEALSKERARESERLAKQKEQEAKQAQKAAEAEAKARQREIENRNKQRKQEAEQRKKQLGDLQKKEIDARKKANDDLLKLQKETQEEAAEAFIDAKREEEQIARDSNRTKNRLLKDLGRQEQDLIASGDIFAIADLRKKAAEDLDDLREDSALDAAERAIARKQEADDRIREAQQQRQELIQAGIQRIKDIQTEGVELRKQWRGTLTGLGKDLVSFRASIAGAFSKSKGGSGAAATSGIIRKSGSKKGSSSLSISIDGRAIDYKVNSILSKVYG